MTNILVVNNEKYYPNLHAYMSGCQFNPPVDTEEYYDIVEHNGETLHVYDLSQYSSDHAQKALEFASNNPEYAAYISEEDVTGNGDYSV